MSFYRENKIAAVRKFRPCAGCGKMIDVGMPGVDCAGHYEGDFWSATYHEECRKAEVYLNSEHQAGEWIALSEFGEVEDCEALLAEFPEVAERLGVTPARIVEIKEREERVRTYWRARATKDRERRLRVVK